MKLRSGRVIGKKKRPVRAVLLPARRRRRRRARKRAPLGKTLKTTMRYYSQSGINPAAASVGIHRYRCNSIFDPDETGVGHQPRGHDELAELYQEYLVTHSKITVWFTWGDATPTTSMRVGIIKTKDPSKFTTALDYMEAGTVVSRLLAADPSAKTKLSMHFNPKSDFGIRNIRDNDEIGANFGANPTDQYTFLVFAFDPEAGDPVAISHEAIIDYDCVLRDPIQPVIS